MDAKSMDTKSVDVNIVTLAHPFQGEGGQMITQLKLRTPAIGDIEKAQQFSTNPLTQDLRLLSLITTNAVNHDDIRKLHIKDYTAAREHLTDFFA